jgi:hypothetical protein
MDSEHAKNCGVVILGQYIWNKDGVPHKGWNCRNVTDTGQATSKCEMCGNGTVRYVHYLEHDEFPDVIKVGSECSKKLAENYSIASWVEKRIKSHPSERAKWSSKAWKISRSGNPYLKYEDYLITIFKDRYDVGKYKFMTVKKEITSIDYGEGPEQEEEDIKSYSKTSYVSVAEAKEAVFSHFNPTDYERILKK